MEGKVDFDTANSEITGWLDCKKISDKKRDVQKDTISTLVDAVADGSLVVEDDNSLTHTLKFAVGKDGQIKDFKYKPRITVGDVHGHLQGVKPSDADGRLLAYVAALTNQTKGIIGLLDTEDYGIAQSIAIFFL